MIDQAAPLLTMLSSVNLCGNSVLQAWWPRWCRVPPGVPPGGPLHQCWNDTYLPLMPLLWCLHTSRLMYDSVKEKATGKASSAREDLKKGALGAA